MTKENVSTLKKSLVILLATSLAASLSACAQPFSTQSADLAVKMDESLGCSAKFADDVWDGLYAFAVAKKTLPSESAFRASIEERFAVGRLAKLNAGDRKRVTDTVVELYQLLAVDSLAQLKVSSTDNDKVLETLTALELGDRTSPEKELVQNQIQAKLAEVDRIVAQVSNLPECVSQPAPPPTAQPTAVPELGTKAATQFETWKATRHPAVYGGLKALATAYQSCTAGSVAALSDATANVKGISEVGMHENGIGKKRLVTDAAALVKSHPYLKVYTKPSSTCFDVLKSPLIYDYGGKPYTGTTDVFDFFKNAGSGTAALGMDCSGYVYASLASAGLKVKKAGKLKAVNVSGISARMYMNPGSNGLDCLDYAKFSSGSNLKPGDVLASTGHVIIIESTGADPFGIADLKKEADCKLANIKVSDFDFTILQSSPVKGGIGIDRMKAADYLAEGGSMATAMREHAVNACLAKARGTAITTKSTSANLIRHLGTAECKDTELKISKQECVASCPMN